MTPKVCILAGGLGTRLSEETTVKPKPMVEIGGRPILWHIMKLYSAFGFNEFIIALGYKGEYIKDYFMNYALRASDLSIDMGSGETKAREIKGEPWKVDLIDTGLHTHTAGRVRRMCEHAGEGIIFMTYGDGVADVDIRKLLEFHKSHGKLATVTAVTPPARFGALSFEDDRVESFQEKPLGGEGWINGGFFILDTRVASYIDRDEEPFEQSPLRRLARDGELMGFRHYGFWHCMDTLRDVRTLEDMWANGAAPWCVWNKTVQLESSEENEPSVLARQKGIPNGPHGL
jgi:glucose-1-phosphate cytidylyltransferase